MFCFFISCLAVFLLAIRSHLRILCSIFFLHFHTMILLLYCVFCNFMRRQPNVVRLYYFFLSFHRFYGVCVYIYVGVLWWCCKSLPIYFVRFWLCFADIIFLSFFFFLFFWFLPLSIRWWLVLYWCNSGRSIFNILFPLSNYKNQTNSLVVKNRLTRTNFFVTFVIFSLIWQIDNHWATPGEHFILTEAFTKLICDNKHASSWSTEMFTGISPYSELVSLTLTRSWLAVESAWRIEQNWEHIISYCFVSLLLVKYANTNGFSINSITTEVILLFHMFVYVCMCMYFLFRTNYSAYRSMNVGVMNVFCLLLNKWDLIELKKNEFRLEEMTSFRFPNTYLF